MGNTRKESAVGGESDPHTVFIKILSGELPASFVYRDDRVTAFMDIQPVNPGHVLVVPNEPAKDLAELNEEIAAHLLRVGHRIAKAIRQTDLKCEGINIFLADGEAAGQDVFHVHLHVIPRFMGDGFGFKSGENNFNYLDREELDQAAIKISNLL